MGDTTTAFRMDNGLYKMGRRRVSYRRAQAMALRRGCRWLIIVDAISRNMVDYIDLVA